VLSWTTIAYGGALSALAAALLVAAFVTPRRASLIVVAAAGGALGPVAWNAILRANFFTDAPVAVFPVSWQDTGSGVFAMAVSSAGFGFGPLSGGAGRRLAVAAVLVGLGAFLVDIYLY
jgi:hypothetical protein